MNSMPNPAAPETPFSITSQDSAMRSLPGAIHEVGNRHSAPAAEQSRIAKGLCLTGDLTGSGPLCIEGKFEGTISLPGSRVTIGRDGWVDGDISAREIVVSGRVRGNIIASHRADIRAEGSFTGNAVAGRISIEAGALFRGGIETREAQTRLGAFITSARTAVEATPPVRA